MKKNKMLSKKKVYRDLFRKIDFAEKEADPRSRKSFAPDFGESHTEWSKGPGPFYNYWLNFCSGRSFTHRDKWNLKDNSVLSYHHAITIVFLSGFCRLWLVEVVEVLHCESSMVLGKR